MKRAHDGTACQLVGRSEEVRCSRQPLGVLLACHVDQSAFPNVEFPSDSELAKNWRDTWLCAICGAVGRGRFGRDHAAMHETDQRTVLNDAKTVLGRKLRSEESTAAWARHLNAQGVTNTPTPHVLNVQPNIEIPIDNFTVYVVPHRNDAGSSVLPMPR